MKTYKDICILEEKLSSFLNIYINPLREGIGFEKFSDECILYSLLEYSKYSRTFNSDERLLYLYDKCCEYNNCTIYNVRVDYDDMGRFVMIVPNNDSPF